MLTKLIKSAEDIGKLTAVGGHPIRLSQSRFSYLHKDDIPYYLEKGQTEGEDDLGRLSQELEWPRVFIYVNELSLWLSLTEESKKDSYKSAANLDLGQFASKRVTEYLVYPADFGFERFKKQMLEMGYDVIIDPEAIDHWAYLFYSFHMLFPSEYFIKRLINKLEQFPRQEVVYKYANSSVITTFNSGKNIRQISAEKFAAKVDQVHSIPTQRFLYLVDGYRFNSIDRMREITLRDLIEQGMMEFNRTFATYVLGSYRFF